MTSAHEYLIETEVRDTDSGAYTGVIVDRDENGGYYVCWYHAADVVQYEAARDIEPISRKTAGQQAADSRADIQAARDGYNPSR